MPVGKPDGLVQGVGESRTAIRIDGVIAAMCAVGDGRSLERHRPGRGGRDEEHVPVRDDGGFHAGLLVMPFGDVDMGIRQGVGAEERRQAAQVGDAVRDLVMGADLGGGDQLAAVTLAVVDRQGMHFPALGQQMGQEHGGIHAAGVDDDGALHLRGKLDADGPEGESVNRGRAASRPACRGARPPRLRPRAWRRTPCGCRRAGRKGAASRAPRTGAARWPA